jgi:cytosine/creatinine deaminase
MSNFSPFSKIDASRGYHVANATLPVCLLEPQQGGDAASDALVRASLTIADGKIQWLAAGSGAIRAASDGLPLIDLDGGMVWPACVDLHTHLDKGHIWSRAPNPSGNWRDALAIVGKDREANWNAEDVATRMDFALRCAFAHGTAAVRTHIDSFGAQAVISWSVLSQMRAHWAGRIALQGVSLAMLENYAGAEGERLTDLVAKHGGVLGAVVINEADPGPALARVFSLARDRDLELDFHADETDNPNSNGLEAIAEAAIKFGYEGRVTAGHCCSLARRPPTDAARTIARVAAAGVTVVSLPMCNMYLQDREVSHRTPRWRGVTLLKELAGAGVPIAFGSDNTRDPFYAYGDLDAVEVFAQAVRVAQLDSPLGGWVRAVTATPARAMGLDAGNFGVGRGADLILFRARSWSELLSRPGGPRFVIRGGQPVSDAPPDYRELDALVGGPARPGAA